MLLELLASLSTTGKSFYQKFVVLPWDRVALNYAARRLPPKMYGRG
jgi:hypothetical protein